MKSSEQITNELAMQCALAITGTSIEQCHNSAAANFIVNRDSRTILQSIPLKDLVDLYLLVNDSGLDAPKVIRDKCLAIGSTLKEKGIEL